MPAEPAGEIVYSGPLAGLEGDRDSRTARYLFRVAPAAEARTERLQGGCASPA
jgi:hypothetical protein